MTMHLHATGKTVGGSLRRSSSAIPAAIAVVVISLSRVALAAGLDSLAIVLACASVVVGATAASKRRGDGANLTPQWIVSVLALLFFGGGFLNYKIYGSAGMLTSSSSFAGRDVARVAWESLAMTLATVLGMCILNGSPRPRTGDGNDNLHVMRRVATISSCLAMMGVALVAARAGSVGAATSALRSHNRSDAAALSSGVGPGLWALFSVVAIVSCCSVACADPRRRWRRGAFALLAVVLLAGALIFGSRLTLVFGVVALAGAMWITGRRFSVWKVAVGVVLVFILSGYLIAERQESVGLQRESTLSQVTYSVLGVSLAVQQSAPDFGDRLRSMDRNLTLLESGIPIVGPRPGDVLSLRADTLSAEVIRNSSITNTGFPLSFPTFSRLCFGFKGGLIFSALYGVLISFIFTACCAVRDVSLRATLCGLTLIFTFNSFKGGDPAADLAAVGKQMIVGAILYAIVWIFSRRPMSTLARRLRNAV